MERLDSITPGGIRQAIDRFYALESDGFVVIICTMGGGLGVNLGSTGTIVIDETDWNLQNGM
jgi:SNF2 family DNA or RNA helicase